MDARHRRQGGGVALTVDVCTLADWPDVAAVVAPAVHAAFAAAGVKPAGELSVVLSDDAHIRQLNRDFRAKDKPTNVLSFPQDVPGLLGDVILSRETLEREAVAQGKTFADHTAHMLVHGVLHLLGFDHPDDERAEAMEATEVRALRSLGIDNPYRAAQV